MRPVRIVAAFLFAATVGVLAPAAPAWAASATTLQVSPSAITAGDTVVVSGSVGPAPAGSACATSLMLLSRAFVPTDEFAGVPAVIAAVKPSGTFTTSTRIPRSTPATTTPAPAPSATAPPATQPTASTDEHRADSWIIPGLVGLAVGAVAAVGVWLLYRSRHPTGLGGSGRSGEV
jgi:hypothetical protein